MSQNILTGKYIYRSIGSTPATDQSPSGQSSVDEATERESAEAEESAGSASPEDVQPEASAEVKGKASARPRQRKARTEGHLNTQYRDLLNSAIEDAACSSDPGVTDLLPSNVGASSWTAAEKAAFFSALAVRGRHDLRGISRNISTKGEVETKAYLNLLEQYGVDGCPDGPLDAVSLADVPAAWEVGPECESALNSSSRALAVFVDKSEAKLEKQKYGELWLIDEDNANQDAAELDHMPTKVEPSDALLDPQNIDAKASLSEDDELPNESMLRADMLLQLSRSLFMNSAPEHGDSWHSLLASDSISSGPAMFRSAFDDLQELVVKTTRRLVQASLFQAMSRLRTKDDSRLTERVTGKDVRVAVDLLDMASESKRYWATVARRCGVDVYSDSRRFHDGRPGTKNGVKLTYDEVDAELGFTSIQPSTSGRREREGDESDMDRSNGSEDEADSDAKTEEDESHQDSKTDESNSDSDDNAKLSGLRERKRKRAASLLDDEDQEEERYLDDLDKLAGEEEERRLWALLKCSPPASQRTESEVAPAPPRSKLRMHGRLPEWRNIISYEAEWERRPATLDTAVTAGIGEIWPKPVDRSRSHHAASNPDDSSSSENN